MTPDEKEIQLNKQLRDLGSPVIISCAKMGEKIHEAMEQKLTISSGMSDDEKEIQKKKISLMKWSIFFGLLAFIYFALRLEMIIDLLSK